MIEEHVALNKLEFRIKTEEEFINDLGKNWMEKIDVGWDLNMNHLFNYVLPKKYNLELFQVYIGVRNDSQIEDLNAECWWMERSMIILNKK